jgi:hypothetical protein
MHEYRTVARALFDDPPYGLGEFSVVEHSNMPRYCQTKDPDGSSDPLYIRDNGYPFPAREMFEAQFGVVPHSAGLEASEVFAKVIEESNLVVP